MNVCSHGPAAVFVIGIYRTAQWGWRNRTTWCCISFIFQWALCNHRCLSGAYFSHFAQLSGNIFTCVCPLSSTATSNGMGYHRQELGETSNIEFFFRIIKFFSPAFCISFRKPSAFPLPPQYLSVNSPRQKDKLPSGLLF